MTESNPLPSDDRDPIELLAEEFMARRRDGEAISIDSFAHSHPDQAEDIRDLFPLITLLEEARSTAETQLLDGPAHPLPELQAIGEFTILEELGRGGMGVVYLAEQTSLERRVALKVLARSTGENQRAEQRFEREAKMVARLEHDHILPIYSTGEEAGLRYFAMKHIEGASLDRLMRWLGDEVPTAPPAHLVQRFLGLAPDRRAQAVWHHEVARLGRDAASALHHAHSKGMLHRDIKPSNLLLDRDGKVWLTDFGVARDRASDTLSLPKSIPGTLRYLAPERLKGKQDERSDLYSLGLTLLELLTLKPSFTAQSQDELQRRIRQGVELPAASALPPAQRPLLAVIARATARDPKERYPDAQALADALHACSRPEANRRRLVLLTAALLATILVAALALFLREDRNEEGRTTPKPAEAAPRETSTPAPSERQPLDRFPPPDGHRSPPHEFPPPPPDHRPPHGFRPPPGEGHPPPPRDGHPPPPPRR
ncbi:MAG: serine/threonine-protein kinase [Planctomycetota bacterium]|jgi:serine/threonine protein kinase